MTLTRSTSEHDGEQVDSHCYGVEDRQGLQSIGNRVSLQKNNTVEASTRQQETGSLIRYSKVIFFLNQTTTKPHFTLRKMNMRTK